jgi:hypothetical protein
MLAALLAAPGCDDSPPDANADADADADADVDADADAYSDADADADADADVDADADADVDADADADADDGDVAGDVFAFVGVDVVDLAGDGRVLEDRTVVISGDRILDVAEAGAAVLPDGAERIDGAGLYLIPGLVDAHVHTYYEGELLLAVANGVTTERSMFGMPEHILWRERIAAGELLGPTLVAGSPIVDGDPPIWPGSVVVDDPADAADTVADLALAGYDFIKVYSNLQADAWRAIVDESEALGIPVAGHVPWYVSYEDVVRSWQSTIEHFEGFIYDARPPGSPPPRDVFSYVEMVEMLDDVDDARVEELAGLAAETHTWNCPTLVVFDRLRSPADSEQYLDDPEMRYVHPDLWDFWSDLDSLYPWYVAEDFVAIAAYADALGGFASRFQDLGAGIIAGTDATNAFVVHGFALHEELRLLVEAGLTPTEALRAATVDAAEAIGLGGEQGAVRSGQRADLVLLRSNPLDDIAATRDRVGVMVHGRWLSQEELDARLEELAVSYGR